jgi:hypothetical protein
VSEDTLKATLRNYAHFHRLLAELLLELADLPDVEWLEGKGHIIRGEGQSNTYSKAIYPVQDTGPYQGRLDELRKVQQRGLELMGREEPTVGLLMPVLIEGVHYVRLRRHVTYTSRVTVREHAILRFEEQLERTRLILKEDFTPHATMFDPKREKVEAEVEALEEGLGHLEESREVTLRERYRTERVTPYVYLLRGEIVRPYVRDVGLIAAGPSIKMVWADNVRRQRSDKVRLEPLLVVGPVEVYSEEAWQEASEKRTTKSERHI